MKKVYIKILKSIPETMHECAYLRCALCAYYEPDKPCLHSKILTYLEEM